MKNRVAASLGHGGGKLTRRSNHRKRSSSFKRKVKSYLTANCFFYAPLVSRQPSDLSPPFKTVDSSTATAGLRRNDETSRTQKKKKKLLQRILEYLQSDSHMYAALIDSPKKADPASGPVHRIEKLSIAISRRITTATRKAGNNSTPDNHVKEDTNMRTDGAMNRELRRLVT